MGEIDDGARTRNLVAPGISGPARWRQLSIGGLPLLVCLGDVLAEFQDREAAEKAKKAGPNDQIVMAAIGVGGQGTGIMKAAKGEGGSVKFVAVCDLDADHLKKAAKVVGNDCHQYDRLPRASSTRNISMPSRSEHLVDHWHRCSLQSPR